MANPNAHDAQNYTEQQAHTKNRYKYRIAITCLCCVTICVIHLLLKEQDSYKMNSRNADPKSHPVPLSTQQSSRESQTSTSNMYLMLFALTNASNITSSRTITLYGYMRLSDFFTIFKTEPSNACNYIITPMMQQLCDQAGINLQFFENNKLAPIGQYYIIYTVQDTLKQYIAIFNNRLHEMQTCTNAYDEHQYQLLYIVKILFLQLFQPLHKNNISFNTISDIWEFLYEKRAWTDLQALAHSYTSLYDAQPVLARVCTSSLPESPSAQHYAEFYQKPPEL